MNYMTLCIKYHLFVLIISLMLFIIDPIICDTWLGKGACVYTFNCICRVVYLMYGSNIRRILLSGKILMIVYFIKTF